MDVHDSRTRSRNMAAIKSKNTLAELIVRRALHSLGYRYRVNVKGLPGSPDIVFAKKRRIVFVHGCFWHRHSGCKYATTPKSNRLRWCEKFRKNVLRDEQVHHELMDCGYKILVVWECELSDFSKVGRRLVDFLGSPVT